MNQLIARGRLQEVVAYSVPIILGVIISTLSWPLILVAIALFGSAWAKFFIRDSFDVVFSLIPLAILLLGLAGGLTFQRFLR